MASQNDRELPFLFVAWLSGVVMVYGVLFFIGYGIFQEWTLFFTWLIAATAGFFIMRWGMGKAGMR